MNYEDQNLTALACELECQIQIPGVCTGGRGMACHANWSEFGKGERLKAHDHFHAAGCAACHYELDQGKRLKKQERKDFWTMGYIRTWIAYWQRGYIAVVHKVAGRNYEAVVVPVRPRRRRKSALAPSSKIFKGFRPAPDQESSGT